MDTCNLCEEPAKWRVVGGRFNEAGTQLSCDEHIAETTRWLFLHPKFSERSLEQMMVELRPIEETS